MKIPLELALRVTGGRLLGESPPASMRVCTDTRSLEAGDTFLALHGERFDGHDFTGDAVRRGAALMVIDRAEARPGASPALLVQDTKAAYMQLAGLARSLFAGSVVGITGSTGKTTTKSFLAQLLAIRYGDRVMSTPENENNEIGVSKLLLRASNEDHDVIIVEMGARHYGDVAELVEIARPQLAVLTNVGEAHLEIMGSHERLAETKWAIFGQGARAVLNAGDAVSRERAPALHDSAHWFAAEESAGSRSAALNPLTALVGNRRLIHRQGTVTIDLDVDVRVPGRHNRENLAAAIAAATDAGVPLEQMESAIPAMQLPAGRYDRVVVVGGLRLIYDAYNANASGMFAALDAFATESATRRIAVLAGMAELGDESKALHERVGAHAAALVDVLLVRGDYAGDFASGARRGGLDTRQIVVVDTNAEAAAWLREHARDDDVVLLKGSRKYRLEEIVEALRVSHVS